MQIESVGRVDLVVEDIIVIELDSYTHHEADHEAYEVDRKRSAALLAMGYVVLRLTYDQVFKHWDEVEQHIRAIVKRNKRRRRPRCEPGLA